MKFFEIIIWHFDSKTKSFHFITQNRYEGDLDALNKTTKVIKIFLNIF